jgi:hypothetical protein
MENSGQLQALVALPSEKKAADRRLSVPTARLKGVDNGNLMDSPVVHPKA